MQFARASVAPVLATLALALAGCPSDDIAEPIDASASCLEANNHSDLGWIQDNIFTGSCSNFVACHRGAASQAGGLSLEPGRSHAELVNQRSSRFPDWTLVIPGDPEMSYLMVALGRYPGPLVPSVGTMPFNSRLLCKEKLDAIERWIDDGAPDVPAVDAGIDAP
jgi:hypothetical protein